MKKGACVPRKCVPVWYEVKYRNLRDGTRDTIMVNASSRAGIIRDIQGNYVGNPPPIEIVYAKKQKPIVKRRLKPLLDVDSRTLGRLNRGSHFLDEVDISLIDLPPVRSSIRYEDNYKKMAESKGVPPVHLHQDPCTCRYSIEDGVHRTHAAKRLGYKSIPALIAR